MPRLLNLTAIPALVACAAVLPAIAAPGAAFAQTGAPKGKAVPVGDLGPEDPGGDKINQLIVYGNDPCPASQGNEITVCARKPESERYRIPAPLRGIDQPQSQSWTNKVQAYETVGASGILSCSPSGSGGEQGCTQKLIDKAYAEKKNGSDVRFSQLIDKERQKRLSTIDAKADAQQKEVEKEEAAYRAAKKAHKNDTPAEAAAQADNSVAPDSDSSTGN